MIVRRIHRNIVWNLICGLILAVITGFAAVPARAEVQNSSIPDGFQLILSSVGVQLYRKDYTNGTPDYVQVINLNRGAEVRLLHGTVNDNNALPGVYGGNDSRFTSLPIKQYWKEIKAKTPRAFCVTSGQFFYMYEYPTRLPFPLKVNGKIVSGGYSKGEFTDQKLMLEIWYGEADIRPLTKVDFESSTAPNILGGLKEDARKSPDKYVGRTFIGVADTNLDGKKETILIFSTQSARQKDAADTLRLFGASEVMMLDGGLSTQLLCQGKTYIETERIIPQALAILDGTKRYIPRPTPQTQPTEPGLKKEDAGNHELGIVIPPEATHTPDVPNGREVAAGEQLPGEITLSDALIIPVPILLISLFLLGFIYRIRNL